MAERNIPERNRLNFTWLITLRWSSIVGQIATILAVRWLFAIKLPLRALFAIVALEFLSNVIASLWVRRAREVGEWHLALVMAIDVLFLTGLLYWTGGPFNPFCFLYLVNISLAAVALQAYFTWMLVAFSLGCFGLLFVDFHDLPFTHLEPGAQAGMLQQGTWVAFGVAAGFIVHFLWRVTRALSMREGELEAARRIADRQDRLASLATMAAGAAHELSTPLGTIAVVAKELERSLSKAEASKVAIEDLQLIRKEVGRCRLILDQMGAGAGKSAELSVERITVVALAREAMTGVRTKPDVRLDLEPACAEVELEVPARALAQALRSLITNAQDASSADAPVEVSIRTVSGQVAWTIRDRGAGMPREVLARVGEPFFTTKAPGSGMGLGLFLSRATVEKLGGRLLIDSQAGQGTTVEVTLPRRQAAAGLREASKVQSLA